MQSSVSSRRLRSKLWCSGLAEGREPMFVYAYWRRDNRAAPGNDARLSFSAGNWARRGGVPVGLEPMLCAANVSWRGSRIADG